MLWFVHTVKRGRQFVQSLQSEYVLHAIFTNHKILWKFDKQVFDVGQISEIF